MEEIFLRKERKDCSYVTIPNTLLRDKKTSLLAKGLLCYMLSCREDWKFSVKGLSTNTGETTYKIQKALDELEEAGYHKKEAIREDGKIVRWQYYVADYPAFIGQKSDEVPKGKNLFEECEEIVNKEFFDPDVKNSLMNYLGIRVKLGSLNAKQFKTIILELRELAKTKEDALEIIKTSSECKWRKFYPLKKRYQKRNAFVDDISPVTTDDEESIWKQKYIEEFSMVPKCDRPSYEEWRAEQ